MVEKKGSEAGYNLVILMVTLTLLNILLTLALPKWSHVIRREREEELISRGFQYAEAIRVFKTRFAGRDPVRIEELIEVEPRSIRKLWKDPMTEDGRWALIPVGQGGQGGQPPTPPPTGPDPDGPSQEPDDGEGDPDTGIGQKKGIQQIGPFTGVHSRSSKESILVFNGRTRYDEWHFTVEMLLAGMGNGMGGVGGDPARGVVGGMDPLRLPNTSTRWIGRPLPAFLMPPQSQMPQDGQMPDGRTRKPPARR
jgi:type II secretory pathway pseudopilin PulG